MITNSKFNLIIVSSLFLLLFFLLTANTFAQDGLDKDNLNEKTFTFKEEGFPRDIRIEKGGIIRLRQFIERDRKIKNLDDRPTVLTFVCYKNEREGDVCRLRDIFVEPTPYRKKLDIYHDSYTKKQVITKKKKDKRR